MRSNYAVRLHCRTTWVGLREELRGRTTRSNYMGSDYGVVYYGVRTRGRTTGSDYGVVLRDQTPRSNYGVRLRGRTTGSDYRVGLHDQTTRSNYGIRLHGRTTVSAKRAKDQLTFSCTQINLLSSWIDIDRVETRDP